MLSFVFAFMESLSGELHVTEMSKSRFEGFSLDECYVFHVDSYTKTYQKRTKNPPLQSTSRESVPTFPIHSCPFPYPYRVFLGLLFASLMLAGVLVIDGGDCCDRLVGFAVVEDSCKSCCCEIVAEF
jgi:hypothetical protein